MSAAHYTRYFQQRGVNMDYTIEHEKVKKGGVFSRFGDWLHLTL